MSSLDKHVGLVRGKLALTTFLRALAWAGIVWATAAFLVVLVRRFWHIHFNGTWVWSKPDTMTSRELLIFWSGGALSLAAALGYTIWKRPSARQAAVAIDDQLGLKEKFSTALYLRPSRDPFAAAAVRDAEQTAAKVNLKNSFPVRFPKQGVATVLIGVLAVVAFEFLPQLKAAEEDIKQVKKFERTPPHVAPELLVKQAIAEAESVPHEVAENEKIKMATGELRRTLDTNTASTPAAQQKAQDLLKEIAAVKQRIADTKKYATVTKEMEMMKGMDAPSPDETGPVADAQRDLAKGDLDKAVEKLADTVNKFDKMEKKDQQKAAEQMEKLAAAVANKANDPNVKKDIQQQLQSAGMNQQQAQQMADTMQKAANGDQQAQKQVQQMANQAIQQANQQQGLTQQQQQAIAKAIQNAAQNGQQKANAQASAQQMSQTTQQLASSMKQASQGQQGQQGKSQQANAQQGQAKQGQQGQGKQGQGQQGQQGQGQQAQQGQGQGQQAQGAGQGQGAQQQMQAQISQLQAMAKDGQGVAAAQQGAGQGQQGQGQQGQGQGQAAGQQAGQFGQGQQGQGQGQGQGPQGNQPGNGGGQNGGVAAGGVRPDPVAVPFNTKQEYSPSQTNEDGKIIASSFVKAPSEKGESHAKMQKVIDADSKEDAGEVEPDRVPRSAQKAVKDYFDTLNKDAPAKK